MLCRDKKLLKIQIIALRTPSPLF